MRAKLGAKRGSGVVVFLTANEWDVMVTRRQISFKLLFITANTAIGANVFRRAFNLNSFHEQLT